MAGLTPAEFEAWKASPDVAVTVGHGPLGEPLLVYYNNVTGEARIPPDGAVWGDFKTDGSGKLIEEETPDPKAGK